MRRRLLGLVVTAGALLMALAPAAAARECRDDLLERIWIDGYVVAGAPFEIHYGLAQPASVSDVVVTVDGVAYPLLGTEPDGVAKARAPQRTGRFEVAFTWRKAGELTCEGRAVYVVTAVPPNSTFGDTDARVDGVWRVKLTSVYGSPRPIRLRWRMRPECDYGACSTRASGRGERFRLHFEEGDYIASQRLAGFCYRPDGRTVRGGYVIHVRHVFRVEREAMIDDTLAYRAARIGGESTVEWVLTRTGRAAGCQGDYGRYRLSGVRER